jgi:hypothetical protein
MGSISIPVQSPSKLFEMSHKTMYVLSGLAAVGLTVANPALGLIGGGLLLTNHASFACIRGSRKIHSEILLNEDGMFLKTVSHFDGESIKKIHSIEEILSVSKRFVGIQKYQLVIETAFKSYPISFESEAIVIHLIDQIDELLQSKRDFIKDADSVVSVI